MADGRSSKRSRTSRAGLVMPVGRISRLLKKGKFADRIGSGAAVYLAAVLEYIIIEVFDIAVGFTRANSKLRVMPRHIMTAVKDDEELSKLLGNVTFPNAGVRPNILPQLLPKSSKKKVKQIEASESGDNEPSEAGEGPQAASQDF